MTDTPTLRAQRDAALATVIIHSDVSLVRHFLDALLFLERQLAVEEVDDGA